jgi:hypothetical protein
MVGKSTFIIRTEDQRSPISLIAAAFCAIMWANSGDRN